MTVRDERPQGGGKVRTRRRLDVVALVFGMVLTAVAATGLWLSVFGSVDWSLLMTLAPLTLVVVGVVGLLLSRRSSG